MKLKIIFLIIVLCAMKSFSQTQWTNYSDQPVLSMDTTIMLWAAYGQPACIIQNDTFKMWYGVASGVNSGDTIPRGRTHYAWSVDGINWNKYSGNPVLDVGSAGQWDDEWLDTPEILWDGNEFKLYYYGDSVYMSGAVNASIGLATSQDGINWTKQGIVLQKGNAGDWDGNFIESPAAYYDPSSGVYAMWYSAQDTAGWIRIGLAVSPDGSSWIKYPTPVLDHGSPGCWEDIFVAVPAVIRTGHIFEMWYSGISNAGQFDSVFVGYAVSLNGTTWIKYPGNPVLSNAPGDTSRYWAVDVVWDANNNEYKLWYENNYKWDANAIYMATSPRNVLYSNNCSVSVSNDTTINADDSIVLHADGGTYYQWDPAYGLSDANIQNPTASPDTTTQYTVLIVNDSCITVDSVLVTVLPVSVAEHNKAVQDVQIYPNPAEDDATLVFSLSSDAVVSVNLKDIQGRTVKNIFFNNLCSGKQSVYIDSDYLSSGMYFLEIDAENFKVLKKIIFTN
ncbi:MAG: T9SS type A sorting domain-containing protein [Bacteroidota bacterium]